MPRPGHLLTLAVAAAAVYLYALTSDNALLGLLVKPIPVLALIAWLSTTPVTPYRRRIIVGLAFSVLGDILLAIPRDLFVFGLAAFLCAHLAYLRGYCSLTWRPAYPALAFAALIGGSLFGLLAGHGLGPLLIPVVLYALTIGAMLWRALACGGLAALGACAFVFSDGLIGIDRFVSPFAAAEYLIILFYWLGQWLIAASVSRDASDKVLIQSGTRSAGSC